ncbi:tetratricopeptide repeat protein [Pseudobutyrivibrio sp.]|uniref:tetratricopeptide repeat protein n=1 Tax=Pseudobutyrivibrio sp. TaxID=2014367 RepID=UPI001E01B18B|nr:tetratricopeptide repeat protein [Pseudobutyrivibrio sp.]MBE5909917.1 tetratricopeptide repeat protein [Pseudobutyrivibrio sp.]
MPITNSKIKIIIIVIAILILLICGIFAFLSKSNSNDIDKYLDLGGKYLEEQDYDNAIAAYTEALKIDDMSINAYIGLADAYIGKDDVESALAILNNGYDLTGSNVILDKINQIKRLNNDSNESNPSSSEDADWVDSLIISFTADSISLGQSTIDEAQAAYSSRSDYKSNLMNEDTYDTVYSMPYFDNPNSGHDEMEFGYLFSAPVDTNIISFIAVNDSSITCSDSIKIGDDINSLLANISCPLSVDEINDTNNTYTSSTGKSLSIQHENGSILLKYSDGEKYITFDIRNGSLYGIAMGLE